MDIKSLLLAVCGSLDPLQLLLRSGAVVRYHCEPALNRQNNAEHVWRVMVILLYLWPRASRALLLAALYHDAAEALVGDIPAPVKRLPAVHRNVAEIEDAFMVHVGLPGETAIPAPDLARLKCADRLELCLTCAQQPGETAGRILDNGLSYVRKTMEGMEAEDQTRVSELVTIIEEIERDRYRH